MPIESLTFETAVNRVNDLVSFYATEKMRLEDNLTKLLLPAGLTFTAAILKDTLNSNYGGGAIFLAAFFLVYAILIYFDLYAAERNYMNAFNLQSDLYEHQDSEGSLPVRKVVSERVLGAYDSVNAGVGIRRYVAPSGKPLIAAIGGVLALLIYWIW